MYFGVVWSCVSRVCVLTARQIAFNIYSDKRLFHYFSVDVVSTTRRFGDTFCRRKVVLRAMVDFYLIMLEEITVSIKVNTRILAPKIMSIFFQPSVPLPSP